jgi:hypothetical protein
MTVSNKEGWQTFLNGRWQSSIPQKPGEYAVMTLGGQRVFNRHVSLDKDGNAFDAGNFDPGVAPPAVDFGWPGLWWSAPFPALPFSISETNGPKLIVAEAADPARLDHAATLLRAPGGRALQDFMSDGGLVIVNKPKAEGKCPKKHR